MTAMMCSAAMRSQRCASPNEIQSPNEIVSPGRVGDQVGSRWRWRTCRRWAALHASAHHDAGHCRFVAPAPAPPAWSVELR